MDGADVFIGVSGADPGGSGGDPGEDSLRSSPWPTPTPRSTRTSPASTRPWWPPDAATSRTRSTTCSPSRASSRGRSRCGDRHHRGHEARGGRGTGRRRRGRAERGLRHPVAFDERVAPAVTSAVAPRHARRASPAPKPRSTLPRSWNNHDHPAQNKIMAALILKPVGASGGDRQPPVLAEPLGGDLRARRVLPALVLGACPPARMTRSPAPGRSRPRSLAPAPWSRSTYAPGPRSSTS